jgi:hypothetical protein
MITISFLAEPESLIIATTFQFGSAGQGDRLEHPYNGPRWPQQSTDALLYHEPLFGDNYLLASQIPHCR